VSPAPITVDIPHQLGLAEARARVERGFGKLEGWVPGASVTDHRWDGDTLHFTLAAMGQSVTSRLEVMADKVRATVNLPPMLALFAAPIQAALQREGPKLLR
jgi:hypothetical protein